MMIHRGYLAGPLSLGEDGVLRGEVVNLDRDDILFDGRTSEELEARFREAVDHYLEHCGRTGKQPERLGSGKLSLRLDPEIHGRLKMLAVYRQSSINEVINAAIQRELGEAKMPLGRLWSGLGRGFSRRSTSFDDPGRPPSERVGKASVVSGSQSTRTVR